MYFSSQIFTLYVQIFLHFFTIATVNLLKILDCRIKNESFCVILYY